MNRLKICMSHRCVFPKGAFFYSTEKVAELAREIGYDGVEFLPTWTFVWEINCYGKLLAPESMVVSGHRDWRLDRVMEARKKGKSRLLAEIKNKYDWVSPPPSSQCLRALRRFQNVYKVPVSTQWFYDTVNFSPVMLELWSPEQGIDYNNLLIWLKGDPKGRGVVLDTAKFTSWLKENRIEDQKVKVFKNLLPHIFEVHYRSKKRNLIKSMNLGGELRDDSEENLKFILRNGFRGRIVVEFGWPDLDDSLFGLFREDLGAFKRLHTKLISFILSCAS